VLTPKSRLRIGKSYIVKLQKGIKDAAGHSLKPTSWTVEIGRP
jgi:hypothetical protein